MRISRTLVSGQAPLGLLALIICLVPATSAAAARIENPIAVFAALDKVTAKISKLEVRLNETVRFGALKVTPRVCYSRPLTETPKTTTFVEVEELMLDGEAKKLFSGWMFAESPGLNAVEHPVFDVWLTACKNPDATAAAVGSGAERAGAAASGAQSGPARPLRRKRRRIRR